jgi:hypothetical protein
MAVTLPDIDKLWEGQNVDKNSLKYLCRKYGPHIILEWINRGLSINNKELVITFYKQKLQELGVELLDKPQEVKDERLFDGNFGDYFSE